MTTQKTATRGPKGGVTIMGVFYKGGQFLPSNEPQRGKWNHKNGQAKKQRKQEVEPYTWEYAPEDGMKTLFSLMNGSFSYDHKTQQFSIPNAQVMNYMRWGIDFCEDYVNRYNNGQRWEYR